MAKWVRLHPHNITQKVETIIEHFNSKVKHLLGGEAKAMVVTSSRLEAVRYKRAFDNYVAEKEYKTALREIFGFSYIKLRHLNKLFGRMNMFLYYDYDIKTITSAEMTLWRIFLDIYGHRSVISNLIQCPFR